MTKKDHKVFKERREHVRLPILHGILEPVELEFYAKGPEGKHTPQPAILIDLSAGGMRLVTFLEPPHSKELNMILKLAGVKEMPITGKISWVKEKGGVFMNGITFSSISVIMTSSPLRHGVFLLERNRFFASCWLMVEPPATSLPFFRFFS